MLFGWYAGTGSEHWPGWVPADLSLGLPAGHPHGYRWRDKNAHRLAQLGCCGICDAPLWGRRRIDDRMTALYGYEGCIVPGRLPPTTTAGEYARRGVILEKGAGGVS